MRRLPTLALTTAVALLLTAAPAFATAEEEASGFGTGQWDGLLLAMVFGIVFGAVLYVDLYVTRGGDGQEQQQADHD